MIASSGHASLLLKNWRGPHALSSVALTILTSISALFSTESPRVTLRWIEGDIRNPDVLTAAFARVDAVIHVAAIIELGNSPDLELMYSVNVDGAFPMLPQKKMISYY